MDIVVAMGYLEDLWHSSRLHSHQLCESLKAAVATSGSVTMFAPKLGRTPNFVDRRFLYQSKIPKADLVHLYDPAYGDSIYRIKRNGSLSVLTVTDIAFWLHRNKYNTFLRKRIVSGVRQADCRIAISRKTDQEMRDALGFGCENVVYLGSDPNLFCYSLRDRVPGRLLHVGSNMPRKEIERILKLLSLLPEPYHFVQVGGEFGALQLQLITDLGVSNRVRQIPFVTAEELVAHYQSAVIMMFPSSYEGYGVPVIEARLCGTPVATTKQVPACEVLQNDAGTKVFDFEVFDCDQSSQDKQKLASEFLEWLPRPMGLENREFHSWDRVASETLNIYNNLQNSMGAR